ncbi:MAG: sugar transferase [Prevotellaceae bacterium]|jgi:lipopolysaccharide/colanic/teichoic acid biosynthesis glycosyltransferase|nr:sugar transferase [Prevotellaceae bacterium]
MNEYRINNPKLSYLILNLLLLGLAYFIVVSWFPFTTQYPLLKYWKAYFIIYIPISFIIGVAFHKYHSYRRRKIRKVVNTILRTDLLVFIMSGTIVMLLPSLKLSIYALFAFVVVMFFLEILVVFIYFSFRNAVNIERYQNIREIEKKHVELEPAHLLDNETVANIERQIVAYSGRLALPNLQKYAHLNMSNTMIVSTETIFNILNLKENRFSTIINLMKLNDIRSINEFFVAIHDKLPYQGEFIGCFLSKSQYKKDFLAKFPPVLNYIFYSLEYIYKRILPKWAFTREIYFWFSGGKKRVLSKAEVYGRLYATGFVVKNEFKAEKLSYFIAEKHNKPIRTEVVNYAPIIQLNRVGKNGKTFKVYKFRTMHPYSEFLQPYIYEKNSLQEGGKFRHDIRITSVGNFMRKYWLDELPMIINLLKGEMKLVGVRPLSKHYFSLYSKELQEKRTHHKPGLLPPFYADMPKTLDEIQASELKYLNACEKNGTFVTDLKYIWKILTNIIFKKARSH